MCHRNIPVSFVWGLALIQTVIPASSTKALEIQSLCVHLDCSTTIGFNGLASQQRNKTRAGALLCSLTGTNALPISCRPFRRALSPTGTALLSAHRRKCLRKRDHAQCIFTGYGATIDTVHFVKPMHPFCVRPSSSLLLYAR